MLLQELTSCILSFFIPQEDTAPIRLLHQILFSPLADDYRLSLSLFSQITWACVRREKNLM